MKTNVRKRRGATVVETAVVLGLGLLILFAILDYGRYMMVRHLVDNAAREGARMAVVASNDPNTSVITAHVSQQLAGKVPNPEISVYLVDPATGANVGNWYDAAYGAAVACRVRSTFTPVVPVMVVIRDPVRSMSNSITIEAVCVMRSEDNR
jgi:Flp pilus assembly protein TadG